MTRRGLPCRGLGVAAMVCAHLSISSALAADRLYTLTGLGTLGGQSSRAAAINASGWVAGESETADGNTHAFVWNTGEGMRDLGTLGGAGSRAFAINGKGLVVGESFNSNGITQAFGWKSSEGIFPLPVTAQTLYSAALAVNDAGLVVGTLEDHRGVHAVMWRDRELVFLPRLPGAGHVQPLDINKHGDVVGQIQTGSEDFYITHAFVFQKATTAVHLEDFRLVPSMEGSSAVSINDRGVVVGYTMQQSAHAFRYTLRSGLEVLEDHRALFSSAAAVNDSGAIVGSCISSYAADETACVWHEGRWYDLNEVTERPATWWLIQAADINAGGSVVGYGLSGENNQAFLLEPVAGLDPRDRPSTEPTVSTE
jgi:probable HAF family extracellular repeat protein